MVDASDMIASSLMNALVVSNANANMPRPHRPPRGRHTLVALANLESRVDELETLVARLSLLLRGAAAIALCVIAYRYLTCIVALGAVATLVYACRPCPTIIL